MEAWSFKKYLRPSVVPCTVAVTGPRTVSVAAAQEYEITLGEAWSPSELAEIVSRLSDPSDSLWEYLRTDGIEPKRTALKKLVQSLDDLSLIGESQFVDNNRSDATFLSSCVDRVVAYLQRPEVDFQASPELIPISRHEFSLLCSEHGINWPGTELQSSNFSIDRLLTDISCFRMLTLALQAKYWRRSSPLALYVLVAVLQRLSDREVKVDDSPPLPSPPAFLDALGGAMYSSTDVRDAVECIAYALVGAPDARKLRSATMWNAEQHKTGSAFMLDVERLTVNALDTLGPSRYLTAISQSDSEKQLGCGCYMEEYHVTKRFVEIITPVLSKRLTPRLRDRLFQYYKEEVGHELYEMQTCEALGLDRDSVAASVPLPLHIAFVDIFTLLADVDPLGYFACVFITEGIHGAPSPVNELLEERFSKNDRFCRVSRQHESLNESLNHPSLSRLFLNDVPQVSPGEQCRVSRLVEYMIELNYRAWDHLYDYYGDTTNSLYRPRCLALA